MTLKFQEGELFKFQAQQNVLSAMLFNHIPAKGETTADQIGPGDREWWLPPKSLSPRHRPDKARLANSFYPRGA